MTVWDFKAHCYDLGRRFGPFRLIFHREMGNVEALLNLCSGGQHVLDVGTGTAAHLAALHRDISTVVLDHSFAMLNKARAKGYKRCVLASCGALPLKNDAFDLILAIGLLEYQKDQRILVSELQRVLASRGNIILTFSQLNLANLLRFFLGNRIYLTSYHRFESITADCNLTPGIYRKSLIQIQVLLGKKASHHARLPA